MPETTRDGPMSTRDLELLGYNFHSEYKPDEKNKFGLDGLNCRAFLARSTHITPQVQALFVYFTTDNNKTTVETKISKLKRFVDDQNATTTTLVVPRSLDSGIKDVLERHFRDSVAVFNDMIWARLEQLLEPYAEVVAAQVARYNEQHYVTPQLDGIPTSSVAVRDPIKHLVNFCQGAEGDNVALIQGEAGLGKSALITQIVSSMIASWRTKRVIPVYLPAKRLEGSQPGELTRSFGVSKIPPGAYRRLILTSLKARLSCPTF